jgi:hypothetical protein
LVDCDLEAELIQIEPEASLLIAHENSDCAKTEIEVLPVGLKAAPVSPVIVGLAGTLTMVVAGGGGAHVRHYSAKGIVIEP